MKRNFEKENRNVDKGIEHAGFMLDRLSQVFYWLTVCSLAPVLRVPSSALYSVSFKGKINL